MARMSSLEAYDLLRFGRTYSEKLAAGRAALESKRGHEVEKGWLEQASSRLEEVLPSPEFIDRARLLPELEELRGEAIEQLQGDWVDVIERLHAGITFHAGSRCPVIEALFPHLKFPNLRRPNVEAATAYLSDFDRRLKSGYVVRMFGTEDFAFVTPVLESLDAAVERWRNFVSGVPVENEETEEVRKRLHSTAKKLELLLRQTRLVAEAALCPWPGLFEEVELNLKPRRRVGKPAPRADGEADAAVASGENGSPDFDAGADPLESESGRAASESGGSEELAAEPGRGDDSVAAPPAANEPERSPEANV